MTADDSKEENSVREVGNCVKGSRIRNPVPPPTALDSVEDVLLEVLGKLKRVQLGGVQPKGEKTHPEPEYACMRTLA